MQDVNTRARNQAGWNAIADDWFGATSLPTYGPNLPKEDTLQLFGDVGGKSVLEIGCGSGHSLLYMARHGASDLWGLDLSNRQIENAQRNLSENGTAARLFVSPMEENPGIPEGAFDIVYSIYALGWTTDLTRTIGQVARYLKPGGTFIFSWDNPMMHCIRAEDGNYTLFRSYHDEAIITLEKGMENMTLINWKLSSYINALAGAGFRIERLVEEIDDSIRGGEFPFTQRHYSPHKAQLLHTSFILKAART